MSAWEDAHREAAHAREEFYERQRRVSESRELLRNPNATWGQRIRAAATLRENGERTNAYWIEEEVYDEMDERFSW